MKFKWRKWNRAIHRDLGYVFVAMTIIYSLSGIAINHLNDWNPNYVITISDIHVDISKDKSEIDKNEVINILSQIGEEDSYKKHYFPGDSQLKVFIDGGNAIIDLDTGNGIIEKIKRRPLFHAMNYLHYNPGKWWAIFSDIFAGALIVLAISGLFIIRGKNGIKGRGAILTIVGIILPILYLVFFY
jgi:hypothetical protein